MSYPVTATFSTEQAKSSGVYPINMYVVNASPAGFLPMYYINNTQDTYGYSMNSFGDLTATETVYTAANIKQGDLKTNIDWSIPDLNISVPNVDRAIESVIQSKNYLRGCEVWCITTFGKCLPSGSDYRHIGSEPNRYAIIKEKMYINNTTSTEEVVTFTCKPKFTLKNIVLPRRRFSRECNWTYVSSDCDPDGNINTASFPTCNYTLDNCRERGNEERFGGFAGIPKGYIAIV